MSSTVFIDKHTIIEASWLNDVNTVVYATVPALSTPAGSTNVGYLPAGSGAVPTDVQTKLRESVSALDFGTTYTQATIQAALTSYGTSAKIEINITPGNWVFSSSVDWSAYTGVVFNIHPGALLSGAYTVKMPGFVFAGPYPIFDSSITVTGLTSAYQEWWGTDTVAQGKAAASGAKQIVQQKLGRMVANNIGVDDAGGTAQGGNEISIAGGTTQSYVLANWYYGAALDGSGIGTDRIARAGAAPWMLYSINDSVPEDLKAGDVAIYASDVGAAGDLAGPLWHRRLHIQSTGAGRVYPHAGTVFGSPSGTEENILSIDANENTTGIGFYKTGLAEWQLSRQGTADALTLYNASLASDIYSIDYGTGYISHFTVIKPMQASSAPAYVRGGLYFDTTLNKLRVGGAAAWETITSV